VNMLSAFWAAPSLDGYVPWVVWAGLWGSLLVVALVPVVAVVRARMNPAAWPDPAWWGLLAVAHAGVIALAGVFYDHSAAWLVAPAALTTGAAVSRLRRPVVRASLAGTVLIAFALVALAQTAPRPAAPEMGALRDWA